MPQLFRSDPPAQPLASLSGHSDEKTNAHSRKTAPPQNSKPQSDRLLENCDDDATEAEAEGMANYCAKDDVTIEDA